MLTTLPMSGGRLQALGTNAIAAVANNAAVALTDTVSWKAGYPRATTPMPIMNAMIETPYIASASATAKAHPVSDAAPIHHRGRDTRLWAVARSSPVNRYPMRAIASI